MKNKGTGGKERGNGEKLEGWKLKMINEIRYINWVGREGLKFLTPSRGALWIECQLKPLQPNL